MMKKRTTTLGSSHPFSSKWWWSGAIRKIRRPVNLNETTWRMTDTASRTKIPPAMTSAAYKADALKTAKYVPMGVHHKRASEVLAANKATPPEVVQFLKDYVGKHSKKRKK